MTLSYMHMRHFEPIQRIAPAGRNNCKGCDWNGPELQAHLRNDAQKKCNLFYSASPNVQTNQSVEANVSVSNGQSGAQRQPGVTEQVSVPWTYAQQMSPEMELMLREFDNVRAKFINGQLNTYEQQDLAQFLGSKGSTTNKTLKRRKDKNEDNTDCPQKLGKIRRIPTLIIP